MRVDNLLSDLLEATAAKTAASRRIDRLRDVLDREARRRLEAEGAAPSWKAPRLGTVRLDPKPAKAYVADPDAFASYVAQRHPSEVTARIELGAADLEAALEALSFAGVNVTRSAVEVRPTFLGPFLESLDVLYDDSAAALESNGGKPVTAVGTVDDAGTLELVPGTGVVAPSASLVVTLDRDRKRAELDRVDALLDAELEDVEAPAAVDLEAQAQAAAIGKRLIDLGNGATQTIPHREPYVGAGADGARRSAEVDRSEVDGLDRDDPRRAELLASAERWDAQAAELEAATADTTYAADVAASDVRDTAADEAATGEPTIAARQRAHAAAKAAAITATLGDPYVAPEVEDTTLATPATSEARPPAELAPVAPDVDDDAVSLGTPDPTAAALVNAQAGAEPFDGGPDGTEDGPGPVDDLLRFTSDDLKRAARAKRVPLNGTKVLLAGRLVRAGVTPDDVLALRPA